MAITRQKKEQLVQAYIEWLGQSQAIIFVYARGLSVAEITELRSKIRETGAEYHVVKNTLFRRALSEVEMPVPDTIDGPVTVAFCVEDIAPTVKAIQDFARELGEREFNIIGGIVERDVLDAQGAEALADMPSRLTLLAQLLAGMQSPATQVVRTVKAPATELTGVLANGIRQIINVLQARVAQLESA